MDGIGATRLAQLLGGLPDTRGPAYRRLAEAVRVLVSDGRLLAGTRLPAERELATALGCSRTTVTHAYAELRSAGWARARQGSGTFTGFPTGTDRHAGAWVPSSPAGDGVLDLAHAAAEAVPELTVAVASAAAALPRESAGHGYHPQGLAALRAGIAARFASRGLPTTPEQIVITHGALHAIATVSATLLGPGDRALVEHPSYPSAFDAITDAGARPVTVPTGGDPVADLPRAARQTSARMAYLIPDFHNPTGAVLTHEQRARLAPRLARLGVTTVVDETFTELALDGVELPPPYAAFVPDDATVTVGTLSKLVWGGLRLGWARAAPELAAAMRTRISRAELAPAVFEQLVGVALLEDLDDIRTTRRATLRARRDATVVRLRERFPHWEVPIPAGGISLWCDLGAPVSSALAGRAAEHGLQLAAGPRFGLGHAFDDHLRIPFTLPDDDMREAIDRLARTARDLPTHAPTRDDERRLIV